MNFALVLKGVGMCAFLFVRAVWVGIFPAVSGLCSQCERRRFLFSLKGNNHLQD